MKKILLSLSTIAIVAAVVIGATTAYFSDTETSVGNTFTAGTIDIAINEQNPWNQSFALADMKPGYTDNINFVVNNNLGDPNPVNVYKKISVTGEATGALTEPECVEQGGTWSAGQCTGMSVDNDNLSGAITYGLNVEVYDAAGVKVWWQKIYSGDDGHTLDELYGNSQEIYLGMVPAGGSMKVVQEYTLDPETTNWAQGDVMTFDIQVRGEQLRGETVLENKTGAPDYKLVLGDGVAGTLTYKVKNATFDYSFTGRAPLANTSYTLLRAVDPWPQTGSVVLGTGTSDANGDVVISGDLELGMDMKDAKVWLVLSSDWNGTQMVGWHGSSYLLETGLIWYEDTDL